MTEYYAVKMYFLGTGYNDRPNISSDNKLVIQ